MTVKTIKAIESAEISIYSRYQLTTKQVRDVLVELSTQIGKGGLIAPAEYHAIRSVEALLNQYMRWKGQEQAEQQKQVWAPEPPKQEELFQ